MNDETTQEHPAFGNISIIRTSGLTKLYDSPLLHHNFITLRIETAVLRRNLNKNWHHPEAQLVEVRLSEAQFAQAIMSMNTTGTPCTLSFYRHPKTGEVMRPKLGDDDIKEDRQIFDEEIQAKVDEVSAKIKSVKDDLAKALGDKVSKKVKEEALAVVGKLQYIIENLPFIQSQFAEAMEKAESVAKTEVVALANALVQQKGLEALGVKRTDLLDERDEPKQLPPKSDE